MCVHLMWTYHSGEGKSHALLYLAALSWAKYISWKKPAAEIPTGSIAVPRPPRVLYIPEWNGINDAMLLHELQPTYYDDPVMLNQINSASKDSTGVASLFLDNRDPLLVILDQACDGNASDSKDLFNYFPNGIPNVKVVIASWPCFRHQSDFLGNDQSQVVPYPFMEPLTPNEFHALAVFIVESLIDQNEIAATNFDPYVPVLSRSVRLRGGAHGISTVRLTLF